MAINIDEKRQKLETIVPEYISGSSLIKWLFLKRISYSINQVKYLKKDLAILDAGCGDWRVIKDLSKMGFTNLYGIDFNENVVLLNIDNAKVICWDLHSTSYKDNKFDVVIILDTLEHIKDVKNVIKELFRIIKNNWVLITSLPTENIFYKIGRFLLKGTFSMKDGPGTGIHYHTAKQLHTYIKKEFKCIKRYYIPFIPPLNLFNMFTYKK